MYTFAFVNLNMPNMEDEVFVYTLIVSLMSVIIALATLSVELARFQLQTRRSKRTWTRSILKKRNTEGAYNLLIPKLLSNDDQFKNYLH